MKKTGFFSLNKSDSIAAVVFFVVSILAFFPFVYERTWNGMSMLVWILSGITLLVPIYNIIAAKISKG
jgi:hypothetical protein